MHFALDVQRFGFKSSLLFIKSVLLRVFIMTVLKKIHLTSWISYFCFELDFGREWKPGTISNNGADVKLQTAEDLYNLLLNN